MLLVNAALPDRLSSRYLNDFFELELQTSSGVKGWSVPETWGRGPSPRESHTAVVYCSKGSYSPKLFLFGGMRGQRLSDLWQLDIGNVLLISAIHGNRSSAINGWYMFLMPRY